MAGFGSFALPGAPLGVMGPQEQGEAPPNGVAQMLAAIAAHALAIPKRAIDASTADVGQLAATGELGRSAVGPATDAALTMLGGGTAMPSVSKAGEVAFGIVPVDVAKSLNFKTKIPDGDVFRRAIENTPGAKIGSDAVTIPVSRRQLPDQEGAESVRGGVFYLPQGSKDAKYYSGTGHNFSYGGSQLVEGETAFKNPLFVKGATGGKAPEAAFDQLHGKGAYQEMRTDALRSVGGGGLTRGNKTELVQQFLEKHAPDMVNHADYILQNSTKGNQLAYALQEAAVAQAARNAGHDGVLGYSTKRNPTKDPFLSEVFDVRENRYPSPSGDYSVFGSLYPKGSR